MPQSNNLQSKIELRHDYIILKRKNVGKTAFSFRHFPTFYNRHLHQMTSVEWHKKLGGGAIADAILDRAVSKSYKIFLEGESLRKIK